MADSGQCCGIGRVIRTGDTPTGGLAPSLAPVELDMCTRADLHSSLGMKRRLSVPGQNGTHKHPGQKGSIRGTCWSHQTFRARPEKLSSFREEGSAPHHSRSSPLIAPPMIRFWVSWLSLPGNLLARARNNGLSLCQAPVSARFCQGRADLKGCRTSSGSYVLRSSCTNAWVAGPKESGSAS